MQQKERKRKNCLDSSASLRRGGEETEMGIKYTECTQTHSFHSKSIGGERAGFGGGKKGKQMVSMQEGQTKRRN